MCNEITTAVTVFQPNQPNPIDPQSKAISLAEKSHLQNTSSHDHCIARGRELLGKVKTEGMSDALYADLLEYLRITKITITKMNERRKPVTQVLDIIRKVYTSLENEINIDKADTIPNKIQQLCNKWAAVKHEEEQRRQRAEAARLAKENAKTRYRTDVEDDYVAQFNALVDKSINELSAIDKQITLDNYSISYDRIKNYDCELPASWCQTVTSSALRPAELSPDECQAIQANVMAGLVNRFKEQYPFEVASTRDEILDRLPSKKKELGRIAKASAEEAARIKAEMEAKERAEAARKEEERREREKQDAAKKQLAADKQEMDGLFGMPLPETSNLPKTQIKKKVVVKSTDDIMRIFAFWWSQEGCTKTIEELTKEFKKQITFANTAANAKGNPTFINGINYEDEIKAKVK